MKKIIGIFIVTLLIVSISGGSSFVSNEKTTVSINGPTVEIISPEDGSTVDDPHIVVEGYSSGLGIVKIEYDILYAGGGMYGSWYPVDPPEEYHEFSIPIDIVEGEEGNVITVTAVDTENAEGSDTITVIYEPGGDTEPPVVIITYPEDGQIFEDPDIILQGYVSDNVGSILFSAYHYWNEEEYEIYSEIFIEPQPFYEFQFDVTLKPGSNTFIVSAYDEANNKGEDDSTVVQDDDPCHNEPTLTDSTGETTFYGLFIGCNNPQRVPEDQSRGIEDYEENAELMRAALLGHEGWEAGNTQLLTGTQATTNNVRNALDNFKRRVQPGDEFVFYFRNHGSAIRDEDRDEQNEFVKRDEVLCVSDGDITDDDLTEWISNFSHCITITVILDCCYSRGFNEVQRRARNANGDLYGDDHINLLSSSRSQYTEGSGAASHRRPYRWNDADNDGIVDAGELVRLRYNSRTEQYYYRDQNGQTHNYNEDEVTVLGDLTKGILESLTQDQGFLTSYIFTRADRNRDGKTTSREAYEYALNSLYYELVGDDDEDGLVNEDDHEYELFNDVFVSLFVDNDNDEDVDEDPNPPVGGNFFPNEPPETPNSISGPTKGKIGVTYTFSTNTFDLDADEVFYWFDWGDGTNSEWIGPYTSGDDCDASHSWDKKGDYVIKVKARDCCFAESDWATLGISMPKNKPYINTPFLRFLENHPLMFPLLRLLMNLPAIQ